MAEGRPGIPLFKIAGIQISLHWMWLLVAWLEIQYRIDGYSSILWSIAEYLTLFFIVLLHELGHALACRSVGGQADHIMLWPLGGVAFVRPPSRPGAVLWSIAAGPLVNLALAPVTIGAYLAAQWAGVEGDPLQFLLAIAVINVVLFVFNMLPIYPLDGGQIVRALLWYPLGQARSLLVASGIGLVAAVGGGVLMVAFGRGDIWLLLLAAYAAWRSWQGLQTARALAEITALPRYLHQRCPVCAEAPPVGFGVRCTCGQLADPFADGGRCPHCRAFIGEVPCIFCGETSPTGRWAKAG